MEYSIKENESKGEEAKNSGMDESIRNQNVSISQQVAGKMLRVHCGSNILNKDHYNSRMELGKRKRAESRVVHLKNFNNWIKSVLISTYCRYTHRIFIFNVI
jgi:hypothetical protein